MQLLIIGIWMVFYGYWAYMGTKVKQTQATEVEASRLVHLAMMTLAFVLALTDWLRVGILGQRFMPESAVVAWIGVIVLAAGVAFAIWARYHLGQYWSGRISIKEGHRLIRTGPYRFVRHPIYTGIVLGMFGTAIAIGEWRGVLAFALMLIAYARKIPQEEQWLIKEFGTEYDGYRHEVKGLVPFIF